MVGFRNSNAKNNKTLLFSISTVNNHCSTVAELRAVLVAATCFCCHPPWAAVFDWLAVTSGWFSVSIFLPLSAEATGYCLFLVFIYGFIDKVAGLYRL